MPHPRRQIEGGNVAGHVEQLQAKERHDVADDDYDQDGLGRDPQGGTAATWSSEESGDPVAIPSEHANSGRNSEREAPAALVSEGRTTPRRTTSPEATIGSMGTERIKWSEAGNGGRHSPPFRAGCEEPCEGRRLDAIGRMFDGS